MSAGYEIPEYKVQYPGSLSDPTAGDEERTFYELEHAVDYLRGLRGSGKVRGFEMRADLYERTITVGDWRPVEEKK